MVEGEDGVDGGPKRSPYNRAKDKVGHEMTKLKDKATKELAEEFRENKHIQRAHGAATDIVPSENIDRFKDLWEPVEEQPYTTKLCFHIVRKSFTCVILPIIDVGTDFATAYQHLKYGDYLYCFLTLFFVFLPGLVLSVSMAVKGIMRKTGDPPQKKDITAARVGRYAMLVFGFPLFYPLVHICVGGFMVFLCIKRRDKEAIHFMGHDLKQFKSLEGFLESGPQFTLQSYILMVGEKKGGNINWDNITKDDAVRLCVLCTSVLISFLSLLKTSHNVNIPDPDTRRTDKQHPENAPCFSATLIIFNLLCILFRIIGFAFFCVYIQQWALLILIAAFLSNAIILRCVGCSFTMVIVLGAISVFVPNGYLLYNFAGVVVVDMTRQSSKIYLICHTIAVNLVFMLGIVGVAIASTTSRLPDQHLIKDPVEQAKFVLGMNISLAILGVLSFIAGLLHWKLNVSTLYEPVETVEPL